MKSKYQTGDRVTSNVMGFYYGLPGTIVRRAQMQYENSNRYIVELDVGIEITLPAKYIKELPEKERCLKDYGL